MLGASNTDWPPMEGAGLATREVNKPGVDVPATGFARPTKGFELGVVLPEDLVDAGMLNVGAAAICFFSAARRSASFWS